MKFFPGQGKVRVFCGWPRKFRKDLESQGKVREFRGWPGKFRNDLKSQGNVREFENEWLWQVIFRKSIYSAREGERVYILMRLSKTISLCIGGLLLKEFFPLRVTPKFSDTVNTIQVKNGVCFLVLICQRVWTGYDFFYLLEGMENCKMSGKNQGKVREF